MCYFSIVQSIDGLWAEGSKLSDVLSCILEESHAMLLLRLASQHAEGGDAQWSAKVNMLLLFARPSSTNFC